MLVARFQHACGSFGELCVYEGQPYHGAPDVRLTLQTYNGKPADDYGVIFAAAPAMLTALRDLMAERDKFGGVPNSSPAWDVARHAVEGLP